MKLRKNERTDGGGGDGVGGRGSGGNYDDYGSNVKW